MAASAVVMNYSWNPDFLNLTGKLMCVFPSPSEQGGCWYPSKLGSWNILTILPDLPKRKDWMKICAALKWSCYRYDASQKILTLKGSPKTLTGLNGKVILWHSPVYKLTCPWRKHFCGVLTKTQACSFLWYWSGAWRCLPSLTLQSQGAFLKEEKSKTAHIKHIRQEGELALRC